MLPTYCHKTNTFIGSSSMVVSSFNRSAGSGGLIIDDGETSDPLVMCFSSTSVVVGRGGGALPSYTVCCKASVLDELLRPAMSQSNTSSIPSIDVDSQLDTTQPLSTPRRGPSSLSSSSRLLPADILHLAQGESLVVTYPLAWSHMHGGELEMLSSFIFSTLRAATALFIAAPLASAYGLGIGLREGDEDAAYDRRSIQAPSKGQGGHQVGSKRTRKAESGGDLRQDNNSKAVVVSSSSSNSSSTSCSEEDSDDSASSDSSGEEPRSKRNNHNNGRQRGGGSTMRKVASSSRGHSSRAAAPARLFSLQIDTSSITVSHVSVGTVQRFVKLGMGARERSAVRVDTSPIRTRLETARDAIRAMASAFSIVITTPAIEHLGALIEECKRVSQAPLSLTELLVAQRDVSMMAATVVATAEGEGDGGVDSYASLQECVDFVIRAETRAATSSSEEEDDDDRGDVLERAVSGLLFEAKKALASLLVDQSTPIAEIIESSDVVGNVIGKLEGKLDGDDENDDSRPALSLLCLSGEVVGWLRKGASSAGLAALVNSASGSRRGITRLVVGDTALLDTSTTATVPPLIEFQGASLVASVGDRDFLKASMTAAEYMDQGAGYIRWRCAR